MAFGERQLRPSDPADTFHFNALEFRRSKFQPSGGEFAFDLMLGPGFMFLFAPTAAFSFPFQHLPT